MAMSLEFQLSQLRDVTFQNSSCTTIVLDTVLSRALRLSAVTQLLSTPGFRASLVPVASMWYHVLHRRRGKSAGSRDPAVLPARRGRRGRLGQHVLSQFDPLGENYALLVDKLVAGSSTIAVARYNFPKTAHALP
jgi:hypothetical protein